MKNKKFIYIAIAAAAIYFFMKKKKAVKGIEEEAEKLAKKQASQLKFSIDTKTMEDLYKEQHLKY
jgi:uncharacterized protein YpmB